MGKGKSFIPEDAVRTYNELTQALEKNNLALENHFKELVKVSDELSKMSLTHKELNSVLNASKSVKEQVNKKYDENRRLVNELARLEQKLAMVESELNKASTQKKVDLQAQQKEMRLIAQTTSLYTTELEKLYAKQELANRAAQKYLTSLGSSSAEYKKAIADAKKYAQEINNLEVNTGKLIGKTTSMYGATFQLTQVMRELPNFAIDARIGFMSLSNNLPMLVDSFQILSKQINEVTGKPYGFAGAMKIFAKSLLSVNTILILASTALVLYGDKLVELFTGKVSAAQKAHEEFIKSLQEGNGEYSKSISEIARLKAVMNNVDGIYITVKDALDEYNNSLGKHIGLANDLETAKKLVEQYGVAYIQVMGMMDYANKLLEKAVIDQSNAEALRADKVVTTWQQAWASISNFALGGWEIIKMSFDARNWFNPSALKEAYGILKDMIYTSYDEVIQDRIRQADELMKSSEDVMSRYMEQWSDMAKFAKENKIDLFPDDTKTGSGSTSEGMRQLRTIFIELDVYSKTRQRITEQMKKAEEQSEKESALGVVNAYDDRKKAMVSYFDNKKKLIDLDYNESVAKAEQERKKEEERVRKAMEYNKMLLEQGKTTEEEYAKAFVELSEAQWNAWKNYDTAVLKAHDERLSAMYDLDVEYKRKLSSLYKDMDDDARFDASMMSGLEILASGIGGYRKDSALAELKAEHDVKMQMIDEEIEKRKKAGEDIASFEKAKTDELNEYKKQADRLVQEQMQETAVELASTTWELIGDLVSNHYEKLSDENEAWAEKENERVDAMVKSEVISEEQAEAQRASIENQREQREKNKYI